MFNFAIHTKEKTVQYSIQRTSETTIQRDRRMEKIESEREHRISTQCTRYEHYDNRRNVSIHIVQPMLYSSVAIEGDIFDSFLGTGVLGEKSPLKGDKRLKGATGFFASDDEIVFVAVECIEQNLPKALHTTQELSTLFPSLVFPPILRGVST